MKSTFQLARISALHVNNFESRFSQNLFPLCWQYIQWKRFSLVTTCNANDSWHIANKMKLANANKYPFDWKLLTKTWSSHQKCYIKKGVLRNFVIFTGKHLCQGLFFNKVVILGLQLCLQINSGTGAFLWISRNF